jgi:hypothetical protein
MSEVQLLLWLTGIHVVGFVCVGLLILPALREDQDPPSGEDSGSSDDGWGNLPNGRPNSGGWPGGGIPLPDAEQSAVRLREPGRLSDRLPRPQRRPVREPVRQPARVERPTTR